MSAATCRRAGWLLIGLAALALGKPTEQLPSRVVFHLQDPTDGLCLSPRGFAACDTTTLWTVGMVKGRQSIVSFLYPSEEAFCLERVPIGKYDSRVRIASCKAKGSLAWNIKTKPTGAMVMADTTQCIARQNNFAAMQPCDFGYTALSVVDAGVHDRGFLLATKDGTCFDGVRFRLCDPKDARLYWGAAVRFDNPRGDGYYSLFKFHAIRGEPGQKCLVKDSSKRTAPSALGECTHSGAKHWALIDGKLTHAQTKSCVKRDEKTGAGKLQPCRDGATWMQWTLPGDAMRY